MPPNFDFLFLFVMDVIAGLVGIVIGLLLFFVFGFGGWAAIIASFIPVVAVNIWAFSKRR